MPSATQPDPAPAAVPQAEAPPTPDASPLIAQASRDASLVPEATPFLPEDNDMFLPDYRPPSPEAAEIGAPSPQSDLDSPTLPDLPPGEPTPPATPSQADADIDDMPDDGIVILIGPQGLLPATVLDSAEDHGTQLPPVPLCIPIQDWHLESEMDVDFFSVTISSPTLLRTQPAGCYVSLVAMAPESRDLDKYKNWVFFTESKCRLAFEPEFKLPLIERLGQAPQHATLLATPHARTFSYGTLRLDTAVVVEALQDIGCQSVQVSAYGIKVPIDHFADPAVLEALTRGGHLTNHVGMLNLSCRYRPDMHV